MSALLAALLLSSCSPKSDDKPAGPGTGGPAVPVVTAQAAAQDVPVVIQTFGNVLAQAAVAVRPQITGPILQVHFQEGQDVKAGDLLFTIDPRQSEAALNQAEANTKRDEAQLASARLEFERTQKLFESKIASRDDYDKAEAAFHALEATVLADKAAVSNAQVTLGFTSVRSPINGRTGSLTVKAGNVVKALDDVLVTVNQIHPIDTSFAVPEQHLPVIRRRMADRSLPVPVMVDVPGESEPSRGTLSFVNNAVDSATGTIQLKATFPNEEDRLWPGQFVQVTLTVSNLVQATIVPSQAVQTSQSGDFVFVVKPDATVEKRPVVPGVNYRGNLVIASGVKPGETVVIDGQLRLKPGSKVNVQTPGAVAEKAEPK